MGANEDKLVTGLLPPLGLQGKLTQTYNFISSSLSLHLAEFGFSSKSTLKCFLRHRIFLLY